MTSISEIVELRCLVSFLGEKDAHGWWNTSFLGATGQRYLAFNFPRSSVSAGVNAVTQAACQLHDERIGRGRVFHLFRLPAGMEEEIHSSLLRSEVAERLIESIPDVAAATRNLEELASGRADTSQGPVAIGTQADILKKSTLAKLAACYLNAFRNGTRVFPYFEGD